MTQTIYHTQDPNWLHKTIRFLVGQCFSLFGSALVQFSIIWYITLETKSGMVMAIATCCSFVPQIFISLFSGVWADRYNRKYLIILGDGITAVATFATAIIFMAGHGSLTVLFMACAIRSIGAGIQTPSVTALLPQIVPQDKLMRVNGLYSSCQSLFMILSPAAGGAVMKLASITSIFFIDVITAVIGISLLATIPIQKPAFDHKETVTGHIAELRAGLSYAYHNYLIRKFLQFYALFMFFLVPVANLTPLLVARTFNGDVLELTLNEVAFGVGSVVGGISIGFLKGFQNKMKTIALSCIAFGVLTTVLGFASNFIIYLCIVAVLGLFIPFFNTPSITLLQERVDPAMMGRVFSLVQIISTALFPMGTAVFGPIADWVRVESLLILSGIVVGILGLVLILNRKLMLLCEPLPGVSDD